MRRSNRSEVTGDALDSDDLNGAGLDGDASRRGDVDDAFRGFLVDPQVRSLGTEDARDCFAELVAAQRSFLDDWDLDGSTVLAESPAF